MSDKDSAIDFNIIEKELLWTECLFSPKSGFWNPDHQHNDIRRWGEGVFGR